MYKIAHVSLKNKETDAALFDQSKQRFYHAIKWNTIEAVLYHAFYFMHQVGLYSLVATHDYGKYGSLISFSFFCIPLLMGALDMALIPHIKDFTRSKSSFRSLISKYFLPQCLLMFTMPALLYIGAYYKVATAINYLDSKQCLLVGLFIALEGSKKLARRVLQLLFYNRYTAAVEVTSIGIYMTIFWSAIWYGAKPSIFLVITPFIAASIPALMFFAKLFYRYYQTLEEKSEQDISPYVLKTQTLALANQVARSLFSSNLLIPLFAGWIGFTQAGIAALAKNITYTLTYFLHKICSPTAAFLSDTQNLGQTKQKDAFALALRLFFIVALVGLIGMVSYNIAHHKALSITALFYMGFFFVVHILEHLFTLYEKFFTAQKKNGFLLTCNTISSIGAVILFLQVKHFNFFVLILLIFSVRIILVIGLSLLIFSPHQVPFLSLWYQGRLKRGSRKSVSS